MFNQFSNEPTSVIFEALANDLDAFERLSQVAVERPNDAVDEIKAFIESRTKLRLKPGLNRDLVNSSLRNVRWSEIRATLAKKGV